VHTVDSYCTDIWSVYTDICLNLCDPEGSCTYRVCVKYSVLGDVSILCLCQCMWSRGISSRYSMWSISYEAMLGHIARYNIQGVRKVNVH